MNSPYQGKFYVSQGYYPKRHDGLDLVGIDSKDIHATQKGVVHYAGWENSANHSQGFGQYVCIKGVDGLFYYFGHLSKITVQTGQSVKITDVIGVEGSTGYSTGSHCHYEVRKAFYKGADVIDICSLSGIPNKEGNTFDDGYRPDASKSSEIKAGDLVKIKQGSNYYDGKAIPSWVINDKWYVSSVSGDRAVLGQNLLKTCNICSPVNTNNLTKETSNGNDKIKALQSVLKNKGYNCEVNNTIDNNTIDAMFKALCDIYSI